MTAKLATVNGQAVKPPVSALISEIKKFWQRIDAHEQSAKLAEFQLVSAQQQTHEAQIETGKRLAQFKAFYKSEKAFAGMTWAQAVRHAFDRSPERADELIRIAKGDTTVEKVRERKKRSMREARAKQKSAPRGTENTPAKSKRARVDDEWDWEDDEECVANQLDKRNRDATFLAFISRIGTACVMAKDCEKVLLPDIGESAPTASDWQQLVKGTRMAANDWAALAQKVEKMTAPATRRRKNILSSPDADQRALRVLKTV